MTSEALILLIGMYCGVGNSPPYDYTSVPKEHYNLKVDCIEHFTNCMVKSGGTIDPKDFNGCKVKWYAIKSK